MNLVPRWRFPRTQRFQLLDTAASPASPASPRASDSLDTAVWVWRPGVDLESMDFSADFICTSGGSELPTLGYIGRVYLGLPIRNDQISGYLSTTFWKQSESEGSWKSADDLLCVLGNSWEPSRVLTLGGQDICIDMYRLFVYITHVCVCLCRYGLHCRTSASRTYSSIADHWSF